jgi:hypothetical protein
LFISEALTLLQTIKALQNTPIARQIKFGYMLAHNRRVLEGVEETYQSALKSPQDDADTKLLANFEQDRVAALEAVAKKDAHGQPLIENNAYVIDNLAKKLPPIEAKLTAAYPDVARIINERTRRIDALGRVTQDIPLRQMPMDDWPDLPESLTTEMMNGILLYLVADDTA